MLAWTVDPNFSASKPRFDRDWSGKIAKEHPVYIIRSRPHGLIYVENPKAGSTSIHALFLRLGKIESRLSARAAFDSSSTARARAEAGLDRLRVEPSELAAFVAQHRDFIWFSVVRHPYSRTVSNYHDKLSRYTLRFDRPTYWRGKLRQVLSGPEGWRSHKIGIQYMQRVLSLEQFVEGLERNGIDFDHHFGSQTRQLHLDTIPYDDLFKLKSFGAGIVQILTRAGVPNADSYGEDPRRLNATHYRDPASTILTDRTKERIQHLYRADFDTFSFVP